MGSEDSLFLLASRSVFNGVGITAELFVWTGLVGEGIPLGEADRILGMGGSDRTLFGDTDKDEPESVELVAIIPLSIHEF